ncbi:hypothetical protein [Arthrobacter sp. AG1021]|uniref:hypothetical protein n=1 Tax=Arthrobacter sp. AG1021 TaxID=2183908 RepID=UPI0011C38CB0|nr:hypothetical protein [Arthrobacter sp. AG1021]
MSHAPAPEVQRISLRLLAGTVLVGAALGALLVILNHRGLLVETLTTAGRLTDSFAIAFGALANGAMLGAGAGLIPGLGALAGMVLQARRRNPGSAATPRGAAATGAVATMLVSGAGLLLLLPGAPAGCWIWSAAGYLALSVSSVWMITPRLSGRNAESAA